MSPLLVHFLRRVALFALVLAFLAAIVPRVLRETGVIGPRVDEVVKVAERSLQAAREYGAEDSWPAMREASGHLQEARALAVRGEGRQARRAAARASEAAIVAQRQALDRHQQQRRQAETIVADVDKGLNGLEELYARVSPSLGKAAQANLVSRLKVARQTGASLILAFELGNYQRVIADEARTRKALEEARAFMAALGGPPT